MQKVAEVKKSVDLSSFVSLTDIEEVTDGRYVSRLVRNPQELEAVLRLRFDVFKRELSKNRTAQSGIDIDQYDLTCEHLIVFEKETGRAVGTYRINSIESAKEPAGFYASSEFGIEDLPAEILNGAVELGRACIAKNHRNTRVLFLLWKGLANYLTVTKKRYLFGCCSIFTQDGEVAANVLERLERKGHIHESIKVKPRDDKVCIPKDFVPDGEKTIELPALVNIYLRIGAKICGEPAIDRDFQTIDFFVVFDLNRINKKYRKLFFGS